MKPLYVIYKRLIDAINNGEDIKNVPELSEAFDTLGLDINDDPEMLKEAFEAEMDGSDSGEEASDV